MSSNEDTRLSPEDDYGPPVSPSGAGSRLPANLRTLPGGCGSPGRVQSLGPPPPKTNGTGASSETSSPRFVSHGDPASVLRVPNAIADDEYGVPTSPVSAPSVQPKSPRIVGGPPPLPQRPQAGSRGPGGSSTVAAPLVPPIPLRSVGNAGRRAEEDEYGPVTSPARMSTGGRPTGSPVVGPVSAGVVMRSPRATPSPTKTAIVVSPTHGGGRAMTSSSSMGHLPVVREKQQSPHSQLASCTSTSAATGTGVDIPPPNTPPPPNVAPPPQKVETEEDEYGSPALSQLPAVPPKPAVSMSSPALRPPLPRPPVEQHHQTQKRLSPQQQRFVRAVPGVDIPPPSSTPPPPAQTAVPPTAPVVSPVRSVAQMAMQRTTSTPAFGTPGATSAATQHSTLPLPAQDRVKRRLKERRRPSSAIKLAPCVASLPTAPLYCLAGANRTTWLADALQKNPHIADLRERLYPLHRCITFCKLYHPGSKEVKEGLTQAHVLQIVHQYLHMKGFKRCCKVLEKESRGSASRRQFLQGTEKKSKLLFALKQAVRDSEEVWDLAIGESSKGAASLEEHLWRIGLQDEEDEADAAEDDVNIWQETMSTTGMLNLCTEIQMINDAPVEVVKAGSFNRLVERLTDEAHTDMQFLKTFLMTYQSFTTPEKLLMKLQQRFDVPVDFRAGGEDSKSAAAVIRARVCNALKKWIEEYGGDFNDRMISQMRQFIDRAMSLSASPAVALMKSFQKMVTETKSRRLVRQFAESPPDPIIPPNFFSNNWTLLDLDEEELARQMTLVDFTIYEQIKASELLNLSWSKPKLKHRAPNVLGLIRRFNIISNWVVATILSGETVRERCKYIAKFVRLGEKLLQLKNFNALMSIIASINGSAVSRLRFTTTELPVSVQRSKSELCEVMNESMNFQAYRARLAATEPPCLPYLGIYLTDLTYVDENPDLVRGLINFSKRNLVYNTISVLQQYQLRPYNLQPVQQIINLLKRLPLRDEQELYQLSLKREPRNGTRASVR